MGWVEADIGEIAEIVRGVTYRKEHARSNGASGFVPILRATNIAEQLLLERDLVWVPAEVVSAEQRLRVGDVVLASSSGSSAVVGKSRMLSTEWNGSFGAFCTVIRTRNGVDSRYLGHYVSAPAARRRWSDLASGTNINNLKRDHLESTPVPLPPLNEQRRIVAAIEEHLSRVDAADALLVGAMRRMRAFQRELFSAAIAQGEDACVGELLLGIEAGKSFKCHSRRATPDEWGVVKVSAMTWGFFDERENKAVLSEERADPRWEIKPGDLLLSRANTTEYVGASVLVAQVRPRLLLSDKSMRLLVRPEVDRAWLQAALSSREVRAQLSAVATGTSDSMRNISQDKVKAARLRVPGLEQQQRIAAMIEEQRAGFAELRSAIERAQRRSASLRRAILERAFRGELVPQDPDDEPASVLLERIAAERAAAQAAAGGRSRRRARMSES